MPADLRRILLVDDHAVVRAGHRALIESAGGFEVVAEVSTGEDALRMAASVELDIAILDLELPGISGLEVCDRLTRQHPEIAVLLVTVHDSPVLRRRAEQAGALGFVPKSAQGESVLEAIHTISEGNRYPEPSPDAEPVTDPLATLTRREFEILRLLAAGNGVASTAETLHISAKTVSNTLTRLRAKLGIRERQGLIRFALEHDLGSN